MLWPNQKHRARFDTEYTKQNMNNIYALNFWGSVEINKHQYYLNHTETGSVHHVYWESTKDAQKLLICFFSFTKRLLVPLFTELTNNYTCQHKQVYQAQ